MHKTAFLTVVYPGIEAYFADFAESLSRQTDKAFDLIIFNENNTVINFKKLLRNIHYKIIPTEPATPIIIRERAFAYLREHAYEYVIFGDADDWFSSNRVEKSLALLQVYDLVINDVDIVTDSETLIKHYFSHHLQNKSKITSEMVLYGNFMGLSAAAIKLHSLPEFVTPKGVVALDWYMFTLMLLSGAKACFTNEMITYYRQYDDNLIGMKNITLESLKKEIAVKLGHYDALKSFGGEYGISAKNFTKLMSIVQNEEELKSIYSKIKKNNINFPFWWENTKEGLL